MNSLHYNPSTLYLPTYVSTYLPTCLLSVMCTKVGRCALIENQKSCTETPALRTGELMKWGFNMRGGVGKKKDEGGGE